MKNYIRNKKGNILIASYFIVALLLIFGAIFLSRAFSEIRTANLFENTAKAFQAAEAVISQAVWGMNNMQTISDKAIQVDSETTSQVSSITQTLTTAQVAAIATSGAATKNVLQVFENYQYGNAVSGKDLIASDQRPVPGGKASLTVAGEAALTGKLTSDPTIEVDIPELYTGIDPLYAEPNLPDLNGNGKRDAVDFKGYFDSLTEKMKRTDPDKLVIIPVPKGEKTVTVDVGTLSNTIELVYVSSSDPTNASTKLEVEVKGTQNNPQLTVATPGKIKSSVSGNGSQITQLFATFSYGDATLNKLADIDKENLVPVAITFGNLYINITQPKINTEAIIFAAKDVEAQFKTDSEVFIKGSDIMTNGAKPTGLSEEISLASALPPYTILFGDASSSGAADVGGGQGSGTSGGFGSGSKMGLLLDPFGEDDSSKFFWQGQDNWEEDWSEDKVVTSTTTSTKN